MARPPWTVSPLAGGTPDDLIFVFDNFGSNFEPAEIMAAYGLVQLEKLAEFNQRRWRNFQVLDQAIAAYDDLDRAAVQEPLLERNIPTRVIWSDNICANPVRRDPVPGTRRWLRQRGPAHGSRAVPAPHHGLTSDDLGYLVKVVEETFR